MSTLSVLAISDYQKIALCLFCICLVAILSLLFLTIKDHILITIPMRRNISKCVDIALDLGREYSSCEDFFSWKDKVDLFFKRVYSNDPVMLAIYFRDIESPKTSQKFFIWKMSRLKNQGIPIGKLSRDGGIPVKDYEWEIFHLQNIVDSLRTSK